MLLKTFLELFCTTFIGKNNTKSDFQKCHGLEISIMVKCGQNSRFLWAKKVQNFAAVCLKNWKCSKKIQLHEAKKDVWGKVLRLFFVRKKFCRSEISLVAKYKKIKIISSNQNHTTFCYLFKYKTNRITKLIALH